MFIALSFIGKLPAYIVDTIYQSRLFFDHDIYLIIDDMDSPFLKELKKFNVIVVNYREVFSKEFAECYERNKTKFVVLYGLQERAQLFIRCFERFFLLYYLMRNYGISDGLFMELDNLIYDDPRNWLTEFSKYELCYMFDNLDRCSSGIMYVKNFNSLVGLLDFTIKYIDNYQSKTEWLNEMSVLYCYQSHVQHFNTIQIIPTHWDGLRYPVSSKQFDKYNDSIFDAAAIGIYLFGNDPNATNKPAEPGAKNKFSLIDYTEYTYDWISDDKGRKIPHIFNGEKWIKINNLHIYTKDLKKALSILY